MIRSAVITATIAISPVGAPAQQADITWSSSFLATNLDSAGQPLDATFTFYLGVFNPPAEVAPWSPDQANTADWADYWITADVALYDAGGNGRFTSAYNLEPLVEGVNLTGKKGYIWGVNRQCPGEWILITNPAWKWPSGGGLAFPENWTVNSGSAVLGDVNTGGVHMRTASVSSGLPPLLRPDLWRSLHFSPFEIANQESTVSGWLADPNGNGLANLVEYAFSNNPRSPLTRHHPVTGQINLSGTEFLSMSVQRDPNCEALLSAEITRDLATWQSGPSEVVVQIDTPTTFTVRDPVAIGASSNQSYLRLQVLLPSSP